MCGIAGLIHRNGSSNIGGEMTAMLQALKHRGPDSTGYAIYGKPDAGEYVLRFKVAEQEEMNNGHQMHQVVKDRRAEVDAVLKDMGAKVSDSGDATEYAFRYEIEFSGDLKKLADRVESIEGAEILSIGNALELIKDLGDATVVSEQYGLDDFTGTHGIGHTRMATESDVDIRQHTLTGLIHTMTLRLCITADHKLLVDASSVGA